MKKHLCIQALLKPFLQMGVIHAVYSPGSRNAPILHTLKDLPQTKLIQSIDERAAGFVALGLAKSTQKPVILTCTSGSAVANYLPAVTEAYYARIPLLLLTADRPSNAIDNWDGQAIRQENIFKPHTRLSLQTPEEYDNPQQFSDVAKEAVNAFQNHIHGPIHINIPFTEPLYDLPSKTPELVKTSSNQKAKIKVDLSSHQGAMVFHGMDDLESSLFDFTYADDAIVLADITSEHKGNIQYWDAALFQLLVKHTTDLDATVKDLQRKTLITTGNITVSKGLKLFLKKHKPGQHFHLSNHQEIGDPYSTQPQVVSPLSHFVSHSHSEATEGWLKLNQKHLEKRETLNWNDWNEFSVINKLVPLLSDSIVHSSSSMTIRYLSFLNHHTGPIYCNRGTSGIDGSTSTAVGHALSTTAPVYLLTGDLAFFYDINGLWTNPLPPNLKIIVMNNEGGGIFDLINGPSSHRHYETLQVTPHHRSVKDTAASFDVEFNTVDSFETFNNAVDLLKASKFASILEIKTNRLVNKTFFNQYTQ